MSLYAGIVKREQSQKGEIHPSVAATDGNKVTVIAGNVEHPMTEAHLINWVVLETKKSWFIQYLNHTDKPVAVFILDDCNEAVAIYECCNLHGFWITEI